MNNLWKQILSDALAIVDKCVNDDKIDSLHFSFEENENQCDETCGDNYRYIHVKHYIADSFGGKSINVGVVIWLSSQVHQDFLERGSLNTVMNYLSQNRPKLIFYEKDDQICLDKWK